MEKATPIVIILSIGIILLGLAAVLGPTLVKSDQQRDTITASGNAEIEAVSDEITLSLRVENTAKTAADAQAMTTKSADALMASLAELVKKEDIETTYYSVQEWREWENNKNVLKGYRATHSLKVTLHDPTVAGKILDSAVSNGAFVAYVNFGFSKQKEKELKQQALKQAAQEANTKAQAVADGLGVNLGKIVSVSESEVNFPVYRMAGPEMMMAKSDAGPAPTPNIAPQTLHVSGQVSVAYGIK